MINPSCAGSKHQEQSPTYRIFFFFLSDIKDANMLRAFYTTLLLGRSRIEREGGKLSPLHDVCQRLFNQREREWRITGSIWNGVCFPRSPPSRNTSGSQESMLLQLLARRIPDLHAPEAASDPLIVLHFDGQGTKTCHHQLLPVIRNLFF